MKSKSRSRVRFWIETGLVVLFCALVASWFFVSETKPLDASQLAIYAGDLRSFSASSALLADQFRDGNVTETFYHEQLELIDEKVRTTQETLSTSDVEPELRSQSDQVTNLGARVDSTINRISNDNAAAPDTIDELKRLGLSLRSLEESLKSEAEK